MERIIIRVGTVGSGKADDNASKMKSPVPPTTPDWREQRCNQALSRVGAAAKKNKTSEGGQLDDAEIQATCRRDYYYIHDIVLNPRPVSMEALADPLQPVAVPNW